MPRIDEDIYVLKFSKEYLQVIVAQMNN